MYSEASKNYKLIIKQFSDPYMWGNCITTISQEVQFLNYNLEVSNRFVVSIINISNDGSKNFYVCSRPILKQFLMPSFCGPLFTDTILKSKDASCSQVTFFLYILQINDVDKSCTFSKINYHTKYQDPTINCSYVAATGEYRTAAMLVIFMVGN
jgi:hypothetical protein